MENWKKEFIQWHQENPSHDDAAHDIYHFERVFLWSIKIANKLRDDVDPLILLAASYFHDLVNVPKDHHERHLASSLSAVMAEKILLQMGFPKKKISKVKHAIKAHSFSAKIYPKTIEAKIIQDADRLDAIGPIGILRTLYISGRLNRSLFDRNDPFATMRRLNDREYSLDHFNSKKTSYSQTLKTWPAMKFAQESSSTLHLFLEKIQPEIVDNQHGHILSLCKHFFLAGKNSKLLFHPNDPFSTQRKVETSKYTLDHLLENKHYSWFINAIKKEWDFVGLSSKKF